MNVRFVSLPMLALPAAAASAQSATADGGSVFQVVFGLGAVLALLAASLWLLKRLTAPRGAAAGVLKVVTATAVGPRERVVIVEVGETWLVLGVAPGQVTTLHQLPRQSVAPAAPGPGSEFSARLRQMMERRGGAG